LDATDCGDREIFGKEIWFTGELGVQCIAEMFVNIELGVQLLSLCF